MPNDLAAFFSLESAAWTATAFVGLLVVRLWSGSPAMFAQWIEYRRAKADERSADWTRLREENKRLDERCQRLEERIDLLEQNEERCREELADVKTQLATHRGYELGKGKARQDAAGIVALDRLEQKDGKP